MDGYSVEEAAEVLGIPQGRVWELIARGVLAGATEGGASMRVFLKPPAGQPAQQAAEPASENGNGGRQRINGEPRGELSPFRELLTEFRSLTERYGQALLALGEARGEVAALRSRVDTLEARIEMRLPYRPSSTVAWEMPDRGAEPSAGPSPAAAQAETAPQPTPAPQPMPAPPQAAAAPPEEPPGEQAAGGDEHPVDAEARRPRSAGAARGVAASLAEALARAEDPTLADLPGAEEAARALAALQRDLEAARRDAEATPVAQAAAWPAEPDAPPPGDTAAYAPLIDLAEELAPPSDEAEEPGVGYAPEAGSPYTTDVVEPDWFADGDFAWLGPEPPPEATEPTPVEEQAAEAGSGPEPSPEPRQAAPEPVAQVAPAPEPDAAEGAGLTARFPSEEDLVAASTLEEPETRPVDAVEPPAEPRISRFGLYRGQPESAPPRPIPAEPVDREEEALMWLGDEFEAADLEVTGPGWRVSEGLETAEAGPTGQSDATADSAQAPQPPDQRGPELPSPEERGEEPVGDFHEPIGDEVAPPAQPTAATPEPGQPGPGWPATAPPRPQAPDSAGPDLASPDLAAGPPFPPSGAPEATTDDWLSGRQGPSADAYRRLRKLFPS